MLRFFCPLVASTFLITCAPSNHPSTHTGAHVQDKNDIQTLIFKTHSRGTQKEVAAVIAVPKDANTPIPLIITQHGSSRDGLRFPGSSGRTDEYSTRIIRSGVERGFAVAAIDAFYGTDIKANNKTIFPNAFQYAVDLNQILSKDPRFDENNIFYTGFSYGAGQVNKSVYKYQEKKFKNWKAVASVEPGCNMIWEPVLVSFPILLIKGSESHYYIEPCRRYTDMVKNVGNRIELRVINGANHFFSTNGKIINGIAVNGCRFNPVIRKLDGSYIFANGFTATRNLYRKKCFTREGGSGKNRLLLDDVVKGVLLFFEENYSKK